MRHAEAVSTPDPELPRSSVSASLLVAPLFVPQRTLRVHGVEYATDQLAPMATAGPQSELSSHPSRGSISLSRYYDIREEVWRGWLQCERHCYSSSVPNQRERALMKTVAMEEGFYQAVSETACTLECAKQHFVFRVRVTAEELTPSRETFKSLKTAAQSMICISQ